MKKRSKSTAADYVLQAVCTWRQSDVAAIAVKGQPSSLENVKLGAKAYRNTNKLRAAADVYMNTPEPLP